MVMAALLHAIGCKTANAVSTLRNILSTVERSLGQLGLLTGLSPQVITDIVQYLSAVTRFVNDAADLLENEALAAAEKAKRIIDWAERLIVPKVDSSSVQAILVSVSSAVNAFVQFFKGKPPAPLPALTDADKKVLAGIGSEVIEDNKEIREWSEKARMKP
jgi:hypothetical protein